MFDEEKYNAARNRVAVELVKPIADALDPRACGDLASYYALEETNPELEFEYKKRAVINGSYLDKKTLVEFIIDEKQSEIGLAIELSNGKYSEFLRQLKNK